MIRFLQVIKFGWKHSAQMASQNSNNMLHRCCIFVDMLYCFLSIKCGRINTLKKTFTISMIMNVKNWGGVIRKKDKKRCMAE